MRIFTGAIVTETNTFSPIPTGLEAFELNGLQHGGRSPIETSNEFAALVRWREMASAGGDRVAESVAGFAQPGGPTVRHVYEALRDELLDDLRRALPVDFVLLYLHGAMVAQGYDDCEGDILTRVRELCGRDAVIGAELDPHSHLTQAMLDSANAIVAYDEYPHTDVLPRAEDLYRLCMAAARKEIRPVSRVFDCRMTAIYPTSLSPMREFVDRLKRARTGKVLSTSLIHGFPWGDVAEAGTKMLAICDGDAALADRIASGMGREFYSLRESVRLHTQEIDRALEAGHAAGKYPIVLADVADNPGGGAPGDATFLLQRLIERGEEGVVTGAYYDPLAVQLCFEAGEGAHVDLRIGGKMGVASGQPVDLRVRVRGLRERHEQDSMDDSAPSALGRCAWVDTGKIQLLLASIRSQIFAPNAFTGIGIALDRARIVTVKSSHHFYGKFAPIAGVVFHVDSPGALRMDFAAIPYRKRDPVYWPRVADPWAAA